MGQDVLSPKHHLPGRGLDQPQDAAASRALATSGLSNEPEHLALLDREAHVVHGLDDRRRAPQALPLNEVLHQVPYFEQRRHRRLRGVHPVGWVIAAVKH